MPAASARASVKLRGRGPVFPYSLVRGGVADEREFAAVRTADPVVGEHYRDIGGDVRREVLDSDRMMYASYRMGSLVYWTRRAVLVHRGEAVFTDGRNLVRARCGNRLSPVPREPTRFTEPPAASGDTPEEVPTLADPPEIRPAEIPPVEIHPEPLPERNPILPPLARNGPAALPKKLVFAPAPAIAWPGTQAKPPIVVPETNTWMMMLGGLAMTFAIARFRR